MNRPRSNRQPKQNLTRVDVFRPRKGYDRPEAVARLTVNQSGNAYRLTRAELVRLGEQIAAAVERIDAGDVPDGSPESRGEAIFPPPEPPLANAAALEAA